MVHSGPGEITLLVTFYSVSSALFAQKVLSKIGVNCTVIPVPRSVSSSCGYALEALSVHAAELSAELNKADIEWESIYRQDTGSMGKYSRMLHFADN